MSLLDKRLAAVFFLAKEQKGSLTELASQAGCANISPDPDYPKCLVARWGTLVVEISLEEREFNRVLWITFWQGSFLKLLLDFTEGPLPLESDPSKVLAYAFRDACQNLLPEVAFLLVHLNQADSDWVDSHEWMILSKEANPLLDLRTGMLYLNQEIAGYATPNPVRDDRESLEVKSGRLVFSGRDWSRY